MKYTIAISIIVASMLAFASMQGFTGHGKGGGGSGDRAQQVHRDQTFERDRMQDRDRIDVPDQDRTQDRDRVHLQDPSSMRDQDIYGNDLMTAAERDQFRKQLEKSKTIQAREQFQAQHEEKMQARALQQGKDLVPPGQGTVYGGQLMSVEERNQYREQLRVLESDQAREQFQAQHREKMTQRAKALEIEVEEAE